MCFILSTVVYNNTVAWRQINNFIIIINIIIIIITVLISFPKLTFVKREKIQPINTNYAQCDPVLGIQSWYENKDTARIQYIYI